MQDKCWKDAGGSVSRSLGLARAKIKDVSATYKIAKSADPSARKAQLHARRILNALRVLPKLVRTNGLAKEKDVNWRAILGAGVKSVGSGEFGSFSSVPAADLLSGKYPRKVPKTVGVKTGKIGPSEVAAIKIAGDNDLGPRLIASKVSPDVKPGKAKIEGADGAIAMTMVPGRSYAFSPTVIRGSAKSDIYWEAMAGLHRLGIAHNDMHGRNILIDDTPGNYPKARFVDFGLAQVSSKAALAEALGAISGKNFQFVANKNNGHALTVKGNMYYIEQLLMDKGLSQGEIRTIMEGGIRKKEKFFNSGAWGKLTEEEAKGLVEDLYDGVF